MSDKIQSVEADIQAESGQTETAQTDTVVVKKSGSGLALLALLVALGVGGAGYYCGQREVAKVNQKITALEQQLQTQSAQATAPNAEQSSQVADVIARLKATDDKIATLELTQSDRDRTLVALQSDVQKWGNNSATQPNDWLFSEADFLLTNAVRKLVLDQDVDTSVSLLKISDEVLAKISDPAAKTVRVAINNDLKQLLSLDSVDQNAVMQRLSQLANSVDELVALNVNFGNESEVDGEQVSDDVTDWKSNLSKTATSFMNHFVRVTPRNDKTAQALLAPNQDIYLRENIRLRLQIAILAVPRQQNELYKQSLETVAAWVRSYFDTNTEVAANFLKSVDELAEQSIYIDVPTQLSSLTALDKILNKHTQEIQKVEISADKGLTEANQAAAQELKTDETKTETPESSGNGDDVQPNAPSTQQ